MPTHCPSRGTALAYEKEGDKDIRRPNARPCPSQLKRATVRPRLARGVRSRPPGEGSIALLESVFEDADLGPARRGCSAHALDIAKVPLYTRAAKRPTPGRRRRRARASANGQKLVANLASLALPLWRVLVALSIRRRPDRACARPALRLDGRHPGRHRRGARSSRGPAASSLSRCALSDKPAMRALRSSTAGRPTGCAWSTSAPVGRADARRPDCRRPVARRLLP
jgi:hypothetical protein